MPGRPGSRRALTTAAALCVLLPVAACSTNDSLSPADVRQIRDAHGVLDDAARAADWDRSVTVYTDDVVLIPPGQPPIVGRNAARAWMDGAPAVSGSVELVEIDGHGDTAWVYARYEVTGVDAGGMPTVTRGSMIEIWRKQADDSWRLARETWNVWAEDREVEQHG